MPILPTLRGPTDLRNLNETELAELAAEIRETIIATVASATVRALIRTDFNRDLPFR